MFWHFVGMEIQTKILGDLSTYTEFYYLHTNSPNVKVQYIDADAFKKL